MKRRTFCEIFFGMGALVLLGGLALAHSAKRHDHRVHNPALCHELSVRASLLPALPADLEVAKKGLPQQAGGLSLGAIRRVGILITKRAYGVKHGHGVKVYLGFKPPKWLELNTKKGSLTLPILIVLPPDAEADPSLPPGKRMVVVINICDHHDHLGEASIVLPKGAKVLGPLSLGPETLEGTASSLAKECVLKTAALWDFSLRPGGIGCCGELYGWDSGGDEYYGLGVEAE